MVGAKMIVIYPQPRDLATFEKAYKEDHVPMAARKLTGVTRFVATSVVRSPQGTPPFCRIAEIHFPSMEALQACMASQGGQETAAHAIAISTGGAPVFLIGEEESITF